ncbi:signal recognition particle protein [Candidatus Parvarchaeota archaeon]|nr:signal recognition particle protein [Candidatus Parvarchaeota archaeon]
MDLGRGLRGALAKITGAAIIDEKAVKELVRELQRALISNDVNVKLVFELSKNIESEALDTKQLAGTSVKEHVVKVVYDQLSALMGKAHTPKLQRQKILMVGLFGSGKTTTCGKLAHFYKSRGLSVALVCADTDRPAAYEQLEQVAKNAGAKFYGMKGEKDVKKIVDMCKSAAKEDIVILDSSGRSGFDEHLVGQLININTVFAPDEKYLVMNADIGQVAGGQAQQFHSAIGLTGVIITKLDGSGKGGGALSAVAQTDAKVAFIGTGEKTEDFEAFDSSRFVGRLLGFPDLQSLLEKVEKITKEEKLQLEQGADEEFTIRTFYNQLRAVKKMGPLKGVFAAMGMADLPNELLDQSEGKLKRFESIINSMTENERRDVQLLHKNTGRIERIAKGCGCRPEEVRELVGQFEKVEKMLGSFKKNRGMRRRLEKMLAGRDLSAFGMQPKGQ